MSCVPLIIPVDDHILASYSSDYLRSLSCSCTVTSLCLFVPFTRSLLMLRAPLTVGIELNSFLNPPLFLLAQIGCTHDSSVYDRRAPINLNAT